MIAELGQVCLALALAIALVSSVSGFWQISRHRPQTRRCEDAGGRLAEQQERAENVLPRAA